jgi:hypothetical protein
MARHRLERRTRAVVLQLVVTGDDPDFATCFQPDLRRTEHMSGRMQADPHALMHDLLPIPQELQVDVAEAHAQHRLGRLGRQIVATAGTGMVAVGMRDDRAVHRPPGVDEEAAGGAEQPLRARDDEIHPASPLAARPARCSATTTRARTQGTCQRRDGTVRQVSGKRLGATKKAPARRGFHYNQTSARL